MRYIEQVARPVWALSFCLSFFFLPIVQADAGCLENTRPVRLGQHIVQLRTFHCAPDENPQLPPIVRVEFLRLSDAVASTLISGASLKPLHDTLGQAAVLKNDVYRTLRGLTDRFGHEYVPSALVLETPKGGNASLDVSAQSSVISLSAEDRFSNALYLRDITDYNELLKGCNHHYRNNLSNKYIDIVFWRSMLRKDVHENTGGFEKYLLSQGCEKELFIAYAIFYPKMEGCSGETINEHWELSYVPRDIIVDVAVFENISYQEVTFNGFYGKQTSGEMCRISPKSHAKFLNKSIDAKIYGDKLILATGDRLIVPLAINLVARSIDLFSGNDNSLTIFDNIKLSQTGAVFELGGGLRLTREYFLPPRRPDRSNFLYGPEWELSSFDVDGYRVSLAKRSGNFLNLTLAAPEASCPYLLSWNPVTDRWTEYGKVLHVARSKDTEQAHTTRISGFRSKFRLAEREPEVAYIDHAELSVELKDGHSLALAASEPHLFARDGQYVVLRMGELLDFEFKLPDGIKESDVNESKLTVFGYYEPNASLVRK